MKFDHAVCDEENTRLNEMADRVLPRSDKDARGPNTVEVWQKGDQPFAGDHMRSREVFENVQTHLRKTEL